MAILSIQSLVSFGYVGNAVAVPALQALGHEVWPINTVEFSNHPGHGRFSGEVKTASEITKIVNGIADLGVLNKCEAIISGYLGDPETTKSILSAVDLVKQANKAALYVLDPVLGDNGRIFVHEAMPEAINRDLLCRADIVLPNQSELGWLTGQGVGSLTDIYSAANILIKKGPSSVIITGIPYEDSMISYGFDTRGAWQAKCPRRHRRFNGCGDLFTALFTGWFIKTKNMAVSLGSAVNGVDLVIAETERLHSPELAIIPILPQLCQSKLINAAENLD